MNKSKYKNRAKPFFSRLLCKTVLLFQEWSLISAANLNVSILKLNLMKGIIPAFGVSYFFILYNLE